MTLPDTTKWLLPDDGHFSLEQLRLYQEENLPAAARHQVEKHLLDCELCADVLAGMSATNRRQTQAAVSQIHQQIKNKIQAKQPGKVRPMYGPVLRIAAALVILLVSLGVFRYWQRPIVTPVPENTMAQESAVKSGSEPLATVIAPPDPVIKPAEPKPLEPVVTTTRSQARKASGRKLSEANQPTLAAASTTKKALIPIDTAAVLDAFAGETADTPILNENTSLPGVIAKNKAIVASRTALAASVENKQMRLSLQEASTAASQIIAGKVLDAATNQGLPGTTVLVKGTALGVATDAEGNFSLALPAGKEELVFNSTGYITQEVKIKPANNLLTVQLKADSRQLSKVVAPSYSKKSTPVNTIPAKPEMGYEAFEHYIRQNLRYPAEAQQQKQEGQVEVGFTVITGGELTDFKIIKSLGPACDAEAIRVIKEGPAWQPALSQGQPQPENVRITVLFKL